jgi:hypothetical protein
VLFKKGNIPWNKNLKGPQIGSNYKHGMRGTKFYAAWRGMINRCKFDQKYIRKGISVCKRWGDFVAFMNDMYESYLDHHKNNSSSTLDRIDNDGDYTPQNCRWVTKSSQNKNKTDTIKLEIDGRTMCLAEVARRHNINYVTLHARLKRYGYSLEEALTMKNINDRRARKVSKLSRDGGVLKTYNSIKEAADDCGVGTTAIWRACQSSHRSSAGFHWQYVEGEI